MNRTGKVISIFLMLFLCLTTLWSQDKTVKKSAKKVLFPDVYLANTNYARGAIRRVVLDSLLRKPLTSHDSTGKEYKVLGFDFTYAERGYFEDSAADLKVFTDYLFEYCPGDTITENISHNLFDRFKPGDTVFIDHVRLTGLDKGSKKSELDTIVFYGKSIKLYITK